MAPVVYLVAVATVCLIQANAQVYRDPVGKPRFEQPELNFNELVPEQPQIRARRYVFDGVPELQGDGYQLYEAPVGHPRFEQDSLLKDNFEQREDEFIEQPHIRTRRQLFGGVNRFPGGGSTQTVGYQAGPAWGSISQSSNGHGFSTPITYSGGASFASPAGHGLSGSFNTQPGIGSHGSVRGQVGIFNTPSHQVTGWAQHDRNFDKNFRVAGPETNSAGLNYLNKNNGAGAFVSGSHTPGQPNTGSIGGNIPLVTGNGGRTRLEATGQTNFGQGMKPNHQVGVQFTHNF